MTASRVIPKAEAPFLLRTDDAHATDGQPPETTWAT